MRGLTGEAGGEENSFVIFFPWLMVNGGGGRGYLEENDSLKTEIIFGTSCFCGIERWVMLDKKKKRK